MMAWADIVAGLIRTVELIAGWARDEGLMRQGAEKAELETLKRRISIREQADEIDDRPVPDRDRDVLDRL